MTQQQMTEEQIKTVANRLGTVMTRAENPLHDAGWLLQLPEEDAISHTTALMKSLPSDWKPRIQDLNNKMLAWLEARQAEAAATENLSALSQKKAETEQASMNNRARFRELLEQNGGTVTPDMKELRAEYLEQQETASDLAGLIAGMEKQLPALADVTGRKADAYVFCHEGIVDERIDTLISDFFIVHGIELTSLLRMKYSQFERNGSAHAPGVIEGANDADALYRAYILNLMHQWTNAKLPLMFRDDVISLAGAAPFRGARTDRRKRKIF
ncbi:hypothetical protein LMA04_17090 [Pseudescherichia vulneris]|uniref:hypothetical protein n=1 Tax=Pseudescherichia vulneris TaxID=566 RepID=UPI00227B296D|nr:hypothetical protein [Pseudescherichia vulneris]WAH51798.1 hypothetical protein LMA04_17090 [Pseudescherichia vulneris]